MGFHRVIRDGALYRKESRSATGTTARHSVELAIPTLVLPRNQVQRVCEPRSHSQPLRSSPGKEHIPLCFKNSTATIMRQEIVGTTFVKPGPQCIVRVRIRHWCLADSAAGSVGSGLTGAPRQPGLNPILLGEGPRGPGRGPLRTHWRLNLASSTFVLYDRHRVISLA